MGGSGGGTQAIASIDSSGSVNNITIVSGSSSAYTRYVKIGGAELERFITITASDTTNVVEFAVKAARGNNINGGELPDDSADELVLYYNTDGSDNFPQANFIGILVPRPSTAEVSNSYDGNGVGTAATNWFTYSLLYLQVLDFLVLNSKSDKAEVLHLVQMTMLMMEIILVSVNSSIIMILHY